MRGSAASAHTSLTTGAPASSAASATAALEVSTEMGTETAAAMARTAGTTRDSSVASSTGSCPGRVDSPPTSIRSAPASTKARACATAAGTSPASPSPEKLSGVTFTMPMTYVRAPQVNGKGYGILCEGRGLSGRRDGVAQQHDGGERADAAGHRGDRPGDGGHRIVVHVAHDAAVDLVDAHVDHGRARLDEVGADVARAPDGDDQHVGAARHRGQSGRARVADCDRGVLAQQQQRDRL